jgi:hypothetical protein
MPSTTRFVGPVSLEGGLTLPAGEIIPADLASTVITTTASSACALLNTTTEVELNATTGTVVISTTSSVAGQRIFIRAATVAGGSYTLAVTGGTLTFNSAGEAAMIQRNAANSAWLVVSLTASSSTGANIATIV